MQPSMKFKVAISSSQRREAVKTNPIILKEGATADPAAFVDNPFVRKVEENDLVASF